MTRLKVLYLAQHLTLGGAEELLRQVATGLPPERFDVVVGCLTRVDLIGSELQRGGVRLELIGGEPGPRDMLALARLAAFIRRERPDIVHTFLISAGLYGRLAAWLARVPAIYHAEQNIYLSKSRRHIFFERFLAQRTTKVVACCRAVGTFYQRQVGLESKRLEVIYNAVDFAAVRPHPDRAGARAQLGYGPRDLVIGCLGRLTEQKGYDVLLESLARLSDSPRARLFIAGQGHERAALEARAAQLGLLERTQYLGVRRDRDVLYAAMDVFVLPSRWEGLSLALVEAAGAGLPIVATDVGGNTEVVVPGPGVWFVPPDDTAALAAALSASLASVDERQRVAGNDRYERSDVVEQFGLSRHLVLLEASYRSALGLPISDSLATTLTPG